MRVLRKQKNKKDVLFLCQFFFPEYVSSAMLPYQTAKYLKDKGYRVGVLTGYPKQYSTGISVPPSEFDIKRIKYPNLKSKNFFSKIINYFSFTFLAMLNVFRFRKYKVIIVYSNPPVLPIVAVMMKKLFNCKIVFVSYDIYPEIAIEMKSISGTGIIKKVMSYVNEKLFKNVDRVVALSDDMKLYLTNNRSIESNKIKVIHNWATEEFQEVVNVENLEFLEIKRKYSFIISYFGNMGTAQDIETIVEIINKTSDKKIAFLFAGHGNKVNDLKAQLEDKDNVFIFDFLSGKDLDQALCISDMFFVSLERNLAGLAVPSKTYSYYQQKKPVISIMSKNTDIAKELKEFGAGISIENDNSDEAVLKINKIVNNKEIYFGLQQGMKKLYEEKYQKEFQFEKYEDLISKLVEDK